MKLYTLILIISGLSILSTVNADMLNNVQDLAKELANQKSKDPGITNKGEITFVGKPTNFTELDKTWVRMTLKPGHTYLRTSTVSVKGTGIGDWAGVIGNEVYIDWLAETSWNSRILYNNGDKIIELRHYFPGNKIMLIEAKTKYQCTSCVNAARVLYNYANSWKNSGSHNDDFVSGVKTAIGETLEFISNTLGKAKYESQGDRARQKIISLAQDYKGFLEASLFSNIWYLIEYNTNSNVPDKIVRLVLSGDKFITWKATTTEQKSAEKTRIQTIIRSAYLLDAGLLPEDKKLEPAGKNWFVNATSFGQVFGNDFASDLDKIAGTIEFKILDTDLKKDGRNMAHFKNIGSKTENKVSFIYKPKEISTLTKKTQSIQILPDTIDILFNKENQLVDRIMFAGTLSYISKDNVKWWPDTKLTAHPYILAEYSATALEKVLQSSLDKQTLRQLKKLAGQTFSIDEVQIHE